MKLFIFVIIIIAGTTTSDDSTVSSDYFCCWIEFCIQKKFVYLLVDWFSACGISFYRTCGRLLPHLNNDGKKIINGFFQGISQLRGYVYSGNIPGQIENIGGIGVPGLKKLESLVPCPLNQVIGEFIGDCEFVVNQHRTLTPDNKVDQHLGAISTCTLLREYSNKIDLVCPIAYGK